MDEDSILNDTTAQRGPRNVDSGVSCSRNNVDWWWRRLGVAHSRDCVRPLSLYHIAVFGTDHKLKFPAVENPGRIVAVGASGPGLPGISAHKSIAEIITRRAVDGVPSHRDTSSTRHSLKIVG
jgi:hypothetical protein